jgi:hypothetical protein
MKTSTIILLLIVLGGCKEITYKEPQPKGKKELKKFPDELQGVFVIYRNNQPEDTVKITPDGAGDVKGLEKPMHFKDSLVIKSFKGYFFANHLYKKGIYQLVVLQQQTNGDIIYSTMPTDTEKFDELCFEVSRFVTIDSARINDESIYQIDPTPKQLIKLIEAGLFSDKQTWKRIHP